MVSILNRTAQVQPDGSFILPNIPSNMGQAPGATGDLFASADSREDRELR